MGLSVLADFVERARGLIPLFGRVVNSISDPSADRVSTWTLKYDWC